MAAGGAGMRLFRMIVSVFVMLIAGLIGFFVGIRIDEAMGDYIFLDCRNCLCDLCDRESGKMKKSETTALGERAFRGLLLFYFTYSYFLI